MNNFIKKIKEYWYLILLSFIIFIIGNIVGSCLINNKKVNENLIISLNDTIQVWKDKDSLNHAKISILETETTKQFLSMNLKDKENKELQELVKSYEKKLKNNGSATIFNTETKYITDTIINTDSSCVNCNIAFTDFNDWITTSLSITPDGENNRLHFILDYRIKNKYEVVIGEEKSGFLRKRHFVEVKNLNPYTETTSLRTYQVTKPKEKRWYIGPSIFGGVGNKGFIYGVGISGGFGLVRF